MLGCPHPVTVKRISALIHRWPRLVDLIFVDFLRAHDTWTSVLSPRSRRLWEDGRDGEKGGRISPHVQAKRNVPLAVSWRMCGMDNDYPSLLRPIIKPRSPAEIAMSKAAATAVAHDMSPEDFLKLAGLAAEYLRWWYAKKETQAAKAKAGR